MRRSYGGSIKTGGMKKSKERLAIFYYCLGFTNLFYLVGETFGKHAFINLVHSSICLYNLFRTLLKKAFGSLGLDFSRCALI